MADVTITPGPDPEDRQEHVTLSVNYYLSLLAAKRELRAIKAGSLNRIVETNTNVTADQLLSDYPELVDYAGMSTDQAMDTYSDLFDYEVIERDC